MSETFRKIQTGFSGTFREYAKAQKMAKKPKKVVDTYLRKRGRGRPGKVIPSEVVGRADNYRWIFSQVWDRVWPKISIAETVQEVGHAFQEGASPYTQEFMPALTELVLKVLRERKFPKRKEAQINFLADSLAAYGWVSARRSRDICERERLKAARATYIKRYEWYIECSCGYKGRSLDRACPKCKAQVPSSSSSILSPFAN